jgi:hypothetical protein
MGPVQAMDNLIALKSVYDFLNTNDIVVNKRNVIAYGFSHGAYLAYLMNALMPNVLSCIIDNSGWLYPLYIGNNRVLFKDDSEKVFDYLISHIIMDTEIYDLNFLYRTLDNVCHIISYHGMDDNIIAPTTEKIRFCSKTNNMSIELIGVNRIDGRCFQNTDHGLGADFIELFKYTMENYNTQSRHEVLIFEDRVFSTTAADYSIENEYGIPILYYGLKKDC